MVNGCHLSMLTVTAVNAAPSRSKTPPPRHPCLLAGLFILLWAVTPVLAQVAKVTLEMAKAHYTLEVAEHLTWPQESSIQQFDIGIIGDDPELRAAFEELESSRTIRGKPFRVTKVGEIDASLARFSLLFISKKSKTALSKINRLRGNALVVVDGPVRRAEQMVNLVEQEHQVLIRINRDRLVESGFVVSNTLVEFAGSREDLTRQLRDKEQALRQLAAEAEEKQSLLEELNASRARSLAALEQAQHSLAEATARLRGIEQTLLQQQEEIERAEAEITQNKQQIAEQQQLMAEKEKEIEQKEQQMQQLQSAIAENEQILQSQHKEIRAQTNVISTKEQTIGDQRDLLHLIGYIGAALVVFLGGLVRLNQLRNRANRKLASLNAKLYELATTDSLSKLFNRRHFSETAQKQIKQLQRSATPAAMLMLDIDFFKEINDTHGHAMGDQVIVAVARVLHAHLREYDIVGRMGGEEFAMLLSGANLEMASAIAERLRCEIEATNIELDGVTARVTISIGISLIRADDKTLDQPLNRADRALYDSKQAGRNRVAIAQD